MYDQIVPLQHVKNNVDDDPRWRPVAGYDGRYEVSCCGNVRSLHGAEPLILAPMVSSNGYLQVSLCIDGKCKTHHIHHLVAAAWIGPRPAGAEVHHHNGDKTDNSVGNLRYMSRAAHRRMHAREFARQRGRFIAKRLATIGGAK